MLRVDSFEHTEIFVNLQALLEKFIHLHAFCNLQGSLVAVVIVALGQSALVG